MRVMLFIACLALIAPLIGISVEGAEDPSGGLESFSSKKGGYEVLIPDSWHKTEISKKGFYEAALSREKVETEEDSYTYGVSIVRLANFRGILPFQGEDPKELALQYANDLAGYYFGIGENKVVPLPSGDHGADTSELEVVVYEDTPECLKFRLVIAVRGAEWFHAQWEIPCGELETRESELDRMVESLVISPKWKR